MKKTEASKKPIIRTRFSDFIRNASYEEKNRVYLLATERASAKQMKVIEQANAMD